eukprot:3210844-Prymnesium_polylepis.1
MNGKENGEPMSTNTPRDQKLQVSCRRSCRHKQTRRTSSSTRRSAAPAWLPVPGEGQQGALLPPRQGAPAWRARQAPARQARERAKGVAGDGA